MHMHAATGEGMHQNILIRKEDFVVQCRGKAGLTDMFA
jgi:hypothetical protein